MLIQNESTRWASEAKAKEISQAVASLAEEQQRAKAAADKARVELEQKEAKSVNRGGSAFPKVAQLILSLVFRLSKVEEKMEGNAELVEVS